MVSTSEGVKLYDCCQLDNHVCTNQIAEGSLSLSDLFSLVYIYCVRIKDPIIDSFVYYPSVGFRNKINANFHILQLRREYYNDKCMESG